MAYNGVRFVCVGDSGNTRQSTNGTSWSALTGLIASNDYYSLVAYGTKFLTIDSATLRIYEIISGSTTWQFNNSLPATIQAPRQIAYGNGVLVVGTNSSGTTYIGYNTTNVLTYRALTTQGE